MIQLYLDGALSWDSREAGAELLQLVRTGALNKSGSLTLQMPPGHPCCDLFNPHRTIVELYRDGARVFRGRPLYATDNLLRLRTVTCEGERGFFRDAVTPPHVITGTPEDILLELLTIYNGQVEAFKQFSLGTVTVTDPNDYVRLESSNPESVAASLDKLVERCGGYIVFSTEGGSRRVNWYASSTAQNNQTVELGSNLLDYEAQGLPEDYANRIYAYGARDEDTDARLTLEGVTGELYVENPAEVARVGVVGAPFVFDDITTEEGLLRRATAQLAASREVLRQVKISAVDLSAAGYSVDRFREGDNVRVLSAPHGLDRTFLLQEITEDLLNPAASVITLGASVLSLTTGHAADLRQQATSLEDVRADLSTSTGAAINKVSTDLHSELTTTAGSIQSSVKKQIADNFGIVESYQLQVKQLADSYELDFKNLTDAIDGASAENKRQYEELHKYIRFSKGDVLLGDYNSKLQLKLTNEKISFLQGGAEVAYINGNRLYITDGEFLNRLQLGKYAFLPRANGNLSFTWTGGAV